MFVCPIPAPIKLIPLVMAKLLFQVHEPAGTKTVSPDEAALIALDTSAREQLAAV
jgi:hypothetical protein